MPASRPKQRHSQTPQTILPNIPNLIFLQAGAGRPCRYNEYAFRGDLGAHGATRQKLSVRSFCKLREPLQARRLHRRVEGCTSWRTGGQVFADTLEQHIANVEKWFAFRRKRGEM